MNFRRPFSAQIFAETEIRIVDADGAVVALFPRLTDDLENDLARARAIAGADLFADVETGDAALWPTSETG